ncbi:MAG TPA: barstar family protein [Thermoanaerobaculia bacterium]|nr:barstar family protein [Thermoanaerobaculia bacterium]HQR66723.1 barstar family protein [Thermoanaerobaculia bacterium]
MSFDLDVFRFGGPVPRGAHVARIPAGIDGKTALFRALVPALALPDWFGANWDALEECLRDLSWIEKRTVALVHEDLPALPQKELATYLSILSDSVADWKEGDEHALAVVFPAKAERAVRALARPR